MEEELGKGEGRYCTREEKAKPHLFRGAFVSQLTDGDRG